MRLIANLKGHLAKTAIDDLLRDIDSDLSSHRQYGIPLPHHGEDYRQSAIRLVEESRAIEKRYTKQIFAAAKKITNLCKDDWVHDPKILSLFQKLARIVACCSDYPDVSRRVGALNISHDGKLLAFGANTMPVGIPLQDIDHDKGQRNKFRNCAEITVFARRLGLSVMLNDPHGLGLDSSLQPEGQRAAELVNRVLREAVGQEGAKTRLFKDDFLFITIPPCTGCAEKILQVGLGGIIVPPDGAEHLVRSSGMDVLQKHSALRIIHYPPGSC